MASFKDEAIDLLNMMKKWDPSPHDEIKLSVNNAKFQVVSTPGGYLYKSVDHDTPSTTSYPTVNLLLKMEWFQEEDKIVFRDTVITKENIDSLITF